MPKESIDYKVQSILTRAYANKHNLNGSKISIEDVMKEIDSIKFDSEIIEKHISTMRE